MNRRYAILGLSVFLALALAVPALGGPSNPVADVSATAKGVANKALNKAKKAQQTANSANSLANTANNSAKTANDAAKTALDEAKKGQTGAAAALAAANAAKAAADAANANANTRIKSAHDVFGTATASNNTTAKSASASCPANEETLGGGWSLGGTESHLITITDSEELFYGGGWFIAAEAIAGTPTWSLTAIAMCGAK